MRLSKQTELDFAHIVTCMIYLEVNLKEAESKVPV
jgi:hypothetical protein